MSVIPSSPVPVETAPSPTPTPAPELTTPSPAPTANPSLANTTPTPTPDPEAKPEVKPEPAPAPAPEPIDLASLTLPEVLPEGLTLDGELGQEFTSILNDASLSRKDLAQKLVDLQLKSMTALGESRKTAWEELQTQWRTAAETDAEVGGENLPTTLSNVAWLLDTFGDPEVRHALDLTGAGNNPAMFKFLNRIAGKYREGGTVPSGNPPANEKTQAQRLFSSMNQ